MKHLQGNEIVELLDKDEKVIRTAPAEAETVFRYLNPGDYFLRLFIDTNGNGKWDTGNYIDSNSKPDYRVGLEAELKALRESEMWRAGETVRTLRPENN